jgi:hypothetical protein
MGFPDSTFDDTILEKIREKHRKSKKILENHRRSTRKSSKNNRFSTTLSSLIISAKASPPTPHNKRLGSTSGLDGG